MDKAFEVQKQVRDNVKTFQTYLTDLQNWEAEMKRKEAALNGAFEQDLPPVRSKLKKEKPVVVRKKPEKRISAFDYQSWDKFDVDKACEDVDMEEVGPVSLDSKKSQQAKQEKLREEAQHEKERGNNFVKQKKWDEAISCYSRAIELVKDDAIYFANRGLCYLKKESLHQAESDCTEALRLDPTYVKALQRRATARERLGSLRAASRDLAHALELEPHNREARSQLEAIKARMGTKGAKSKSSPSPSPLSTPTNESKPIATPTQPKIIELPDEPLKPQVDTSDLWRDGFGENITVIKPVKKPPHLRSKRPLKHIPIEEILLGKTTPERPPTRLKIIELEDDLAHGDSNNNNNNKKTTEISPRIGEEKGKGDMNISSPESVKLITDVTDTEKTKNGEENLETGKGGKLETQTGEKGKLETEEKGKLETFSEKECVHNFLPPVNSVQFMSEWKYLKGKDNARSDYLSIIDPSKIPSIFSNALESDVLSDVIEILHGNRDKFKEKTVGAYLKGVCTVKRFFALAMFLTDRDKKLLTDLLHHCKTEEKLSEADLADLKNKYEI